MWNEEFTDVQREFVRTATEEALAFAREQDIPAPDPVFRPEERDISSKRSEQRLVAEKTKEVWQQAKPFVTDTFYLNRAENTVVHENAFWEQHAYMGMRENMYAQSGQHSFYIDSQRDRTPSASNHRYQIGKLSTEETRSMLHETNRMLIARARHNAELVGNLVAAIDITKGNPWTGKIERDEADNITEDWILGYKDGEVYYQWATIQIVGYDIPLVLDAIPVKRGMTRADIVDNLLGNALDLVDDIELVMMDREFDSEGVKDACDNHGVCYLNGARKRANQRRRRVRGSVVLGRRFTSRRNRSQVARLASGCISRPVLTTVSGPRARKKTRMRRERTSARRCSKTSLTSVSNRTRRMPRMSSAPSQRNFERRRRTSRPWEVRRMHRRTRCSRRTIPA